MLRLAQFGLLLFALLLIPWFASHQPPWKALSNPEWVQAWGSIGAILVGFAYVAFQNHWQLRQRRSDEREYRLYVVTLIDSALSAQDEIVSVFQEAALKNLGVDLDAERDNQDIVADELLTVTPDIVGRADFALLTRQAGHFTKAFSGRALRVRRGGPVDQSTITALLHMRSMIEHAAIQLRPMIDG